MTYASEKIGMFWWIYSQYNIADFNSQHVPLNNEYVHNIYEWFVRTSMGCTIYILKNLDELFDIFTISIISYIVNPLRSKQISYRYIFEGVKTILVCIFYSFFKGNGWCTTKWTFFFLVDLWTRSWSTL